MNIISFPFLYLRLTTERGWPLFLRDGLATVVIALAIGAPFAFFDSLNFFGPSGLVDKLGTFASVLAGFYIAALLAVATFASALGDLDSPIKKGKVLAPGDTGEKEELSRREYVCALFGYLSALALLVAVLSILITLIAPTFAPWASSLWTKANDRMQTSIDVRWIKAVPIVAYSMIVSSMLVTTLHGLYYLIDRLYAQAPRILPKKGKGGEPPTA
ncbi:hypothetical protein [Sphingomonas adhaesiva]|uniref:hypothetical protein n=1 Tax=Sphingomonas adhaesiva TaxID=28212 RepID=UPI002FFA9315